MALQLRRVLDRIVADALDTVDPHTCVSKMLERRGQDLLADCSTVALSIGKAAVPMIRAARQVC